MAYDEIEVLKDIRNRVAKMEPSEVREFINTCKKDGRFGGLDDALTWLTNCHEINDRIIYEFCWDLKLPLPKEVWERLKKLPLTSSKVPNG